MLFHNKTYKFNSPIVQIDRIYLLNGGRADLGEGPGGPRAPLFLDQTEARRAEKKRFLEIAPPLSQRLDDPPHPPSPLSEGLAPPL